MVLEKRDLQRHNNRMMGVPALLQKLKEVELLNNKFGFNLIMGQ